MARTGLVDLVNEVSLWMAAVVAVRREIQGRVGEVQMNSSQIMLAAEGSGQRQPERQITEAVQSG